MKINAGQPHPAPNMVGKRGQSGGIDRSDGTGSAWKKDFAELVSLHAPSRKDSPAQTGHEKRLRDVRDRIESGTYAPDSEAVARGLLKSVVKGGNLLSRALLASL
jgi:anti-sigma28 factor (negative regulator of flagellin synthesis)